MIISGKELAASLKGEMAAQVATFGERYGRVPHLAVVLVGEDTSADYREIRVASDEIVREHLHEVQ